MVREASEPVRRCRSGEQLESALLTAIEHHRNARPVAVPDTGLTPSQVRETMMGAQHLPRIRIIYQRANDRGEIDLERIPPAVLAMPFDLVRHDMLMDLGPVKSARIQSIVNELFLPLVLHHQAGRDSCPETRQPPSSRPLHRR